MNGLIRISDLYIRYRESRRKIDLNPYNPEFQREAAILLTELETEIASYWAGVRPPLHP